MSVHRQRGVDYGKFFRTVRRGSFVLSDADVAWPYEALLPSGKRRNLYLDGRVPLEKVAEGTSGNWEKSLEWLKKALAKEEHGGYDSRHKNLPVGLESRMLGDSADYTRNDCNQSTTKDHTS